MLLLSKLWTYENKKKKCKAVKLINKLNFIAWTKLMSWSIYINMD